MDANFIGEVLDYLKCVICHMVLKDPVLLVTCGHRLCEECFQQVRDHARQNNVPLLCPHDRDEVDIDKVVEDKGIARAILDLKVGCDYSKDGCIWAGELRLLQDHLDNHCSATAMKRLMEKVDEKFAQKDERINQLEAKLRGEIKDTDHKVDTNFVQVERKYADCDRKYQLLSEVLEKKENELHWLRGSIQTKDFNLKQLEEKMLHKDEELALLRYELSQLKMKVFRKESIPKTNAPSCSYLTQTDNSDASDGLAVKSTIDITQLGTGDESGSENVEAKCQQKDTEIAMLKLRLSRMSNELFHLQRERGMKRSATNDAADQVHSSKVIKLGNSENWEDSSGSSYSGTCIKNDVERDCKESGLTYVKRDASGKHDIQSNSMQYNGPSRLCSVNCVHCSRLKLLEERILNVDDYVPNGYTRFTWKISNLSHYELRGETVRSPKFYSSLHGHCCLLTIRWPDPDKHLALYFSVCKGVYGETSCVPFTSNIQLKCMDRFGVENEWTIRHANMLGPGEERSPGRGYHEFLTKNSLRDYVQNDTLVITCILSDTNLLVN